jgi:hypothetical protein
VAAGFEMVEHSKRIGRPTKAALPGTRVSLGLKVRSDIKELLETAARASGRTQSQEAEARLERSFDHQELLPQVLELAYGRGLAGVLLMLGEAMKTTGESAGISATAIGPSFTLEGARRLCDIPYAYDQAVRAAGKIFEALRPTGDPQTPKHMRGTEGELYLGDVAEHLGERLAAGVLAEAASGRSRAGNGGRERARTYHKMLGRLTKRLKDVQLPDSDKVSGDEG